MSNLRVPAKSFTDLLVWQKSHRLVLDVYQFSEGFPKSEIYGLTSQLRRSMVSVPANIAEGFKKRGIPDKMRFLNIAQGSLEESKYYFILANDLGYGDSNKLLSSADEVGKMIQGYLNSLNNKHSNS